ncbi:hypothetical protein NQ317_016544 [Molorchus minor]|uniref:C2H2-type domain-containing protein n=1 Tax=Molorchus minor TaxID=1323400 RepID=A0ABQ9J8M8_9CUCU|nr:hypothetical protein NQ317_016544 [Molorchus minor]
MANEWSLGEHMIKNHTGQNKSFCNICNRICNNSNDLEKHIDNAFMDTKSLESDRVKQDFRSFMCNICNRNFNDAKYLKKALERCSFYRYESSIRRREKTCLQCLWKKVND